MDEVTLVKGQRITYTGKDGVTIGGVVDVQRRGWVMVDLDAPVDTGQGWRGQKMMLKTSGVTVVTEGAE
jgi:hypothetical protein